MLPSQSASAFATKPRGAQPEVEFGYTPGWDLITAQDANGHPCGRVVCISPHRAIIVFEGRLPPARFHGQLRLPIDSDLGAIPARQVGDSWRHLSGDHVAAVEIEQGSRSRELLGWLRGCVARGDALPPQTAHIEFERIHDSERVTRILAMLHDAGASATVRSTGTANTLALRARFDQRHGLLVEWDRARPLAPPLHVSARGYDSMFELIWPDSVSFKRAPAEIVRIRRRRERRAEAPPRVAISFRHPLTPHALATRAVVDLSIGGLGFSADTAADGLYPGLALPVSVSWKHGPSLEFNAVVRHCTHAGAQAGPGTHAGPEHADTCGLSLVPVDDATGAAWGRQIAELLHPNTRLNPSAVELWGLYEESGYFSLSDKTNLAFHPLERAFAAMCERIAEHPTIAAHVGRWSMGRLEAAASQIEVWSGSWLLFQVARSPNRPLASSGDDVLRDLYVHAYEHVGRQADARYLLTYVQDVARFSRLCQIDFGTRRAEHGLASVTAFRAIELATTPDHPDPSGSTAVIAIADEPELRQCAWWVARNRPIHYQRATGLDHPTLALGPVAARWQAAGLNRAREVLVARTAAGPEAALILEAADEGLHLFRLLDIARFIPLRPSGVDHLPALLDAARRWYAARGKQAFVYFEEQTPEQPPQLADATDLGLAYAVALPVESLPELLEHVFEITTPK